MSDCVSLHLPLDWPNIRIVVVRFYKHNYLKSKYIAGYVAQCRSMSRGVQLSKFLHLLQTTPDATVSVMTAELVPRIVPSRC